MTGLSPPRKPGNWPRSPPALSRDGVQIKALAGLGVDGQVMVRIIADEADAARSGLVHNLVELAIVTNDLDRAMQALEPPDRIGHCTCERSW